MKDIITSTKNEYIKKVKSLKTKKGRTNLGLFLVEGTKCIQELIEYAPQLLNSIITIENSNTEIVEKAVKLGADIHIVKEHVLDSVSDFKSSQGITALASFPSYTTHEEGFILALDDVADPQNVGTMIRTADAAGCAAVVLSKGCADYLSPKAVRASMGSIFHLPILIKDLKPYFIKLKQGGYRIAVADMNGESEYNYSWQKTCLVIGNESRGASDEILSESTDEISIPMFGKAESLNAAVAAGILIYKIRK